MTRNELAGLGRDKLEQLVVDLEAKLDEQTGRAELNQRRWRSAAKSYGEERARRHGNEALFRKALDKWGHGQINVAQEECAELIVALSHLRRGRIAEFGVAEEVADVLIVAWQMRMMVGSKAVDDWVEEKVERLREKLEGQKEKQTP